MRFVKITVKYVSYFLVAVILLAAGLYAYRSKIQEKHQAYTTMSTEKDGIKALYLLTSQMGYSVERFYRPARFLPEEGVLIAAKPRQDLINEIKEIGYLKKWVESGNTLVIIDDMANMKTYRLEEFAHQPPRNLDTGGSILVFGIKRGYIVYLSDPDLYTNEGLKTYEGGIGFIEVLERTNSSRVLFGEYYHGLGKTGATVWDLLGYMGRLAVIQALIALALFFYIRSRRFGKPVTVFETVKRKENENLYAVSNIYFKASAHPLVLDTYVKRFKRELSKFLGLANTDDKNEIISAASGNRYLCEMKLKELLFLCDNYIQEGRKDTKKLLYLVERIEIIRKGIIR